MGLDGWNWMDGNSNLFLSMLFREAFVNTSGIELEIYDTNGSEGAARAAALGMEYYANEKDAFKNLKLISKLKPCLMALSAICLLSACRLLAVCLLSVCSWRAVCFLSLCCLLALCLLVHS